MQAEPLSSRFVLPLTLCSFWTETGGATEGAGVDARFSPDSVIVFPVAQRKVDPSISEGQRMRHVTLRGLFHFIVAPSGRVVDVIAFSCNNDEFREACCEAIRQWTFAPMQLNGVGVHCRLQVPIVWNA